MIVPNGVQDTARIGRFEKNALKVLGCHARKTGRGRLWETVAHKLS